MTREASTAGDRLKGELQRSIERIRMELDKIEILSAAMFAFSKPIPAYDSGFRHLRHATVNATELKRAR